MYSLGGRHQVLSPQFAWNTAQRLVDMDSLSVDVQVVSTFIGYYQLAAPEHIVALRSLVCDRGQILSQQVALCHQRCSSLLHLA